MSKVWEDEEIRNATAEEQEQIDAQGGGSSRYELIATEAITSSTYRKVITLPQGYDELYVDCSELQGEGNLRIIARANANSIVESVISGFLNNTDKVLKCTFNRVSPIDYMILQKAQSVTGTIVYNVLSNSSNITYDDKLTSVVIGTGDNTKFITSGTIKVYGRNLTNE